MKTKVALSGLFLAGTLVSGVAHANLIANGDFSLGNTGFSSQYRYMSMQNVSEGVYAITSNPTELHSGATSYGDHTSGSGNMMVVNGATNPNVVIWEQSVAVLPSVDYVLSGWAASWGHYGDGIDTSPARLQFFLNNSMIGGEFSVEKKNGVWAEFQWKFNSGSLTNLPLSIVDANLAYAPNDFSLDDLSLTIAPTPIQEPSPLMLLAAGLTGLAFSRQRFVSVFADLRRATG